MARCFRRLTRLLVVAGSSALFAGCPNEGSSPPPSSLACCLCDRPPGPLVTPPARPSAHGASGESRWFVLRAVQLERTPGKPSSDDWQHIGFDLDGRDTTVRQSKDPTDTCRRFAGAPTGMLADGCGGIDNNFLAYAERTLEYVVDPRICWVSVCPAPHNVEADSNGAIAAGVETLLVRVDDVTSGDEAKAPGAIFRAARFPGGAPTFEATETWPVSSDSLVDGEDIGQPIVTFPDGYVADGTWVSNAASARFVLALHPGKRSTDPAVDLPIDHGMLVLDLASGMGTLAGAMGVEAFEGALAPIVAGFGTCPENATFEQVMTTFAQSADLVLDAPQLQDTTRECNAISVGIVVTMAPASAPTDVVPPIPPPTLPEDCTASDAGSSDAPDSDASDAD